MTTNEIKEFMFSGKIADRLLTWKPDSYPGQDIAARANNQLQIRSEHLQQAIQSRWQPARTGGQKRLQQLINHTLWQLEKLEASLVDGADRALASVEPRLPGQLPFVRRDTEVLVNNLRGVLGKLDTSFQQFYSHSAVVAGFLPVEGYDTLTAKEAIVAISGLSAEEKKAVRQYEANHKNRTSVLKKLDEAPQI